MKRRHFFAALFGVAGARVQPVATTGRFNVMDIAKIYRVPPHLIVDLKVDLRAGVMSLNEARRVLMGMNLGDAK